MNCIQKGVMRHGDCSWKGLSKTIVIASFHCYLEFALEEGCCYVYRLYSVA